MKRLVVYVHGNGGSAAEAEHYKPLFDGWDVVGFAYRAENPWDARKEFRQFFDLQKKSYDFIVLIANSIGAYFSMNGICEKQVDRALFISPIVDMERLIENMMQAANVSEDELLSQREVRTAAGDTLSWDYLSYARLHPVQWCVPTRILYGERDALTSAETIEKFAGNTGAAVTVMPGGEHWFHTEEQMSFLDAWIKGFLRELQ